MKIKRIGRLFLLCTVFASGWSCADMPRQISQISTLQALMQGEYGGVCTLDSLLQFGTFGIGTFDGLDGEMVILDGQVYQVRSDGRVYRPAGKETTPFAAVCPFTAASTCVLPKNLDYAGLKTMLDGRFPDQNLFYAFQIDGHFAQMKTRSVPAQQKPYPPLAEVTRNQPEFEMHDISGSIVGFRCPVFVKGINVPGYHLHFISEDRTQGGHILSFEVAQATCKADLFDRFYMQLAAGQSEQKALSDKVLDDMIEAAEK